MKIGAALWLERTDWGSLRDAVRAADQAGFDSLWFDDHLLSDEGDPADPKLEGWTVAAAAAAITTRATIGHLVTANTFRSPGLLAKMATTLDHVSEGRAVLGIGAGWFQQEHAAFGLDFGASMGERIDRMGEPLELIRRLLLGERVTHRGRFYHLTDAVSAPRPVQARLPILIGGSGPRRTLALVARFADVWNAYGTPEEVAAAGARLDERCREIGRDPGGDRAVGDPQRGRPARARRCGPRLGGDCGAEPPQPDERALDAGGPPSEVAAVLARYAAVGVGHVMWVMRPPWDLETLGSIGAVRDAVRDALRDAVGD